MIFVIIVVYVLIIWMSFRNLKQIKIFCGGVFINVSMTTIDKNIAIGTCGNE